MPPIRRGPKRHAAAVFGGVPLALPLVVTLPANAITDTTANLNGSVTPEGQATTAWFAWGTTPAYGSSTAPVSVGSGTGPITLTASLSGLTAGETVHFAMVAQSAAGTVFGQDVVFMSATPAPPVLQPPPQVTPSVDTPHLSWPFTITPSGALVDEQDSLDEVFSCVQLIMRVERSSIPELPALGRPDPTFSAIPLDSQALATAVQQQEPRASLEIVESAVQTIAQTDTTSASTPANQDALAVTVGTQGDAQ